MALEELCGESAKNPRKFDACLSTMATRIATVFASLKVHIPIFWVSLMLLDGYAYFSIL